MKYLKLAVFSIGSLFVLITLIGLLFPSRVTVMRAASINQTKDSVYAMLHDMGKWNQWLFDSSLQLKLLSTNSIGPGASAQVGGSKITITHDSAYYIESIWHGSKSRDQICGWNLKSDAENPGTLVEWHYTQQLRWYPWERVGAVLNEKILGPSMDSSLAKLQWYFEYR